MYHNIYKKRNGSYIIIKNSQSYGIYNKLTDALQERDNLESVGWDMDLLCELPMKPNTYENIKLPSFEHNPKYIYIETYKKKVKFAIRKRFNGKRKRFGWYDTLEEAEKVRDLLIENDWDKKKVKRILRDLKFS